MFFFFSFFCLNLVRDVTRADRTGPDRTGRCRTVVECCCRTESVRRARSGRYTFVPAHNANIPALFPAILSLALRLSLGALRFVCLPAVLGVAWRWGLAWRAWNTTGLGVGLDGRWDTQDDDDSVTDDGWEDDDGRRSRRSSVSSDSSLSTLMMDAALASETNDLAAQVIHGATQPTPCPALGVPGAGKLQNRKYGGHADRNM